MEELVVLLKENALTLSSIESITGGLFADSLTNIPSVSSVYIGGLVTYQNIAKTNVAHVNKSLIEEFGVVSKEVAKDMAEQCQNLFKSDISVSFTGNAGPTALDGKPVGLVNSAIRYKGIIYEYEDCYSGDRMSIKKKAVENMMLRLVALLRK